ncbi:50S ribosomal protein L5 [Candidatus Woesearchaeota archaeon]|nr:50S ribosomal protein L5 [Candidatus Woesearchaeota archaeon]
MSKELNPMRNIKIEKITLNIGAGKDSVKLEKGMKLLKNLTNINPIKTFTNKRIPGWGLRPGLPIGCKLTLRKKIAKDMLTRLLDAKDFKLNNKQFDNLGNISFGVPEYIDIKDAKYEPDIGIMGLEVCITLERPGYRIKKRRRMRKKISKNHQITKQDSMEFMKKEFNVEVIEDDNE